MTHDSRYLFQYATVTSLFLVLLGACSSDKKSLQHTGLYGDVERLAVNTYGDAEQEFENWIPGFLLERSISSYDENGNLIENLTFSRDGKLKYSTKVKHRGKDESESIVERFIGEEKSVTKIVRTTNLQVENTADGEEIKRAIGPDGRVLGGKRKRINDGKEQIVEDIFKYDDQGRIVEQKQNVTDLKTGTLDVYSFALTTRYTPEGWVSSTSFVNGNFDKPRVERYEYLSFDAERNWIQALKWDGESAKPDLLVREITYRQKKNTRQQKK